MPQHGDVDIEFNRYCRLHGDASRQYVDNGPGLERRPEGVDPALVDEGDCPCSDCYRSRMRAEAFRSIGATLNAPRPDAFISYTAPVDPTPTVAAPSFDDWLEAL